MRPKSSPRLRASPQRQIFAIPHKEIKIGLFYNERLNPQDAKSVIYSNYQSNRNPMAATVRPTVSMAAPVRMSEGSNRVFSSYLKTDKGTIGKILKFNHPLLLTKTKKNSISMQRSLDLKSSGGVSHSQYNQSATFSANQSFIKQEGFASSMRKDLADKFKRTRLILKEEGKMQRYQKLQSIYDGKNKKLKPGRRKAERKEKEGAMLYSPWQKNKLDHCYEQEYFPQRGEDIEQIGAQE